MIRLFLNAYYAWLAGVYARAAEDMNRDVASCAAFRRASYTLASRIRA